ncbi:unnamed protein product [Nesidiocoris tenuis]|uniref:Uncharacterized protein n=1 Tax=Nesidiocoris tenuis TaxID=355587 RepID=A0A6H5GAE8_9HEMI|nr:unnamed protein product [Nesidiocoris tenuis]
MAILTHLLRERPTGHRVLRNRRGKGFRRKIFAIFSTTGRPAVFSPYQGSADLSPGDHAIRLKNYVKEHGSIVSHLRRFQGFSRFGCENDSC